MLGTVTVRGPVDETLDWVGRDKMLGMVTERMPMLDKELRLERELELGEEVLEMLLVVPLLLEALDEERLLDKELLELELDEELLLEVLDRVELLELELDELLVELALELELGDVVTVLVEGRLGTLMDELNGGLPPPPVHTPLHATIAPLTH